jgi:hypothetical protein
MEDGLHRTHVGRKATRSRDKITGVDQGPSFVPTTIDSQIECPQQDAMIEGAIRMMETDTDDQ